jgi:hypothetical protein
MEGVMTSRGRRRRKSRRPRKRQWPWIEAKSVLNGEISRGYELWLPIVVTRRLALAKDLTGCDAFETYRPQVA